MSLDTSKGHAAMDYAEHTRTYHGFLLITKIMIILSVLTLVGMAYFLV